MGIMNRGVVYGLWDYETEQDDELCFGEGDCMTVLRREDEDETEWWWVRSASGEGYVPRNLLGVSDSYHNRGEEPVIDLFTLYQCLQQNLRNVSYYGFYSRRLFSTFLGNRLILRLP